MNFLISFISITVQVLTFLIFINSLLSFFLDPYHPIRKTIGLVVDPLLKPIRNHIPSMGGLDFSPLILMILLQILGSVLINILRNF